MPDIVITEFMDASSVERLTSRFDTLYDPGLVDRPEAIPALLTDARALVVRNRTRVTDAVLAAAPGLRIVGRLGVGLDNIDVAAARNRGVPVVPATGANDDSVAEYVIAMTLHLLRGAYTASAEVAAGKWPRTRLIGREVSGKTLGLVGFGAIARKTAVLARALGMTVAAFDPYVPADDSVWQSGAVRHSTIDGLLGASDVVSLHVPLTDGTHHLINAAALAAMRSDAVLINAARGGAVDEPALANALKERRLAGAALDVFEVEPLTAAAGAVFDGCPNLVLTPHIAGVTDESNSRVGAVIADAVLAALQEKRT
ncbi:D-isomer specific 2-hydroxyacid dehydrogenase, catalytic region:D-isomer specific 2-hydroxyacid dehydrogenase [alpha proteobacterium BAL199]|jgi:(S)-sulfolactate dehydrogenase|nr:D-isomer specific 2-hydroxyacid dehydrogenase, catalytic region:D-isomer specific 2-hydroxyacid dehydrogenase [alpha proteobacterium BAL199]